MVVLSASREVRERSSRCRRGQQRRRRRPAAASRRRAAGRIATARRRTPCSAPCRSGPTVG